MMKIAVVFVERTPVRPLKYDSAYWVGHNGVTYNCGIQATGDGDGFVYLDLHGTQGIINGGGKIEAELLDKFCQKWLEARGER
jgi:hypothetical protein